MVEPFGGPHNRLVVMSQELFMQQDIEFFIPAERADTAAALREFAKRRLSFALRRFEQRVRHIMVRLVDQNGPRRGVDSRCSMIVELVGGRRIVVEATTAWPFSSVSRAAERLSRAVRKEAGRASSHHGTHSSERSWPDGA
jgi:putative sigma-54 modulation protein